MQHSNDVDRAIIVYSIDDGMRAVSTKANLLPLDDPLARGLGVQANAVECVQQSVVVAVGLGFAEIVEAAFV